MIPYIVAFVLTNLFLYFGEKKLETNKKFGLFLLIIGVIPIIVLGGLRIVTLGWDTNRYCVPIYEAINNMSLTDVFSYINSRGTEPGFVLIIYFFSKIFNNINFVLTGLISIVTYSVLYYAYSNRKKSSIVFQVFLYEMTLYSIAYSTLRQCISLALTFIICKKFLDKKYFFVIVVLFLSRFFHNSAIMAIAALFIIIVNDSKKMSWRTKILLNIVCIATIIVGVLFYEDAMLYLWKIGILTDKYIGYLNSKYNTEVIIIRWPFILYKTFNIVLGLLYYGNKNVSKAEKNENRKWFVMLIIDYVITILSFKVLNAHRTTYYILFPALFIFIPQTMKIFKDEGKNKTVATCLVCIVYVLYFITSLRYYSIYPYRSIFG